MPNTYTKEQIAKLISQPIDGILYDLNLLPECFGIPTALRNPALEAEVIKSLKSALSTAEQELSFFKQRERDICKAVGGVSDGGQYRADVIDHLQIVYQKAQERDALAARCAELEAKGNTLRFYIWMNKKTKNVSGNGQIHLAPPCVQAWDAIISKKEGI